MSAAHPERVVVAGIGSELRGDDGVGVAVASAVAHLAPAVDVGPLGEPLDLLGRWDGAELAVIVDATCSGSPAGSVRVHELGAAGADVPPGDAPASTHGLGVPGVLRIARAVGRAPRRVVLVGVEGAAFERGEGLSPAVARAVPEAVARVVALVEGRP